MVGLRVVPEALRTGCAPQEFYRDAQVHATLLAAVGQPTLTFLCLLGIQIAPLLMTLVRKGLASSTHYHRYYSLALQVPYLLMPRIMWAGHTVPGVAYVLAFGVFYLGRFRLCLNKYAMWTVVLLLHATLSPRLGPINARTFEEAPHLWWLSFSFFSWNALKNLWHMRWIWKSHAAAVPQQPAQLKVPRDLPVASRLGTG